MSQAMHVSAVALWSSDYANAEAWHARRRLRSQVPPPAELLPTRSRGRASVLTRMLAEVVCVAATEARASLAQMPLIIGSAYGEMETTLQLLQMMCIGDGALSPARFQASVHNTGAGHISIAAAAKGFSTSIAAGESTSAAVLSEAHAWLATQGGQVLVAVADETLPAFFSEREVAYGPLAAALLLTADRVGRVLASVGAPRRAATAVGRPALCDTQQAFAHNPVAPMLGVLRVILGRGCETVSLPGVTGSWCFDVDASEAAA
jgi:hypothetical protein